MFAVKGKKKNLHSGKPDYNVYQQMPIAHSHQIIGENLTRD